MKKPIGLLTILSIMTASIFCCCFVTEEPLKAAVGSSCHAQCSSQEKTAPSGTSACECPEYVALKVDKTSPPMLFAALEHLPIICHSTGILPGVEKILLVAYANTGPPSTSVPLYILHANLRF